VTSLCFTRPISDARDALGEGPVWDECAGRLLHVDIARGTVHVWSPADGRARTLEIGAEVSAVVPRVGDGLLLAVGHELVALEPDESQRTLAVVERDMPDNRFNDCRCDPQGRLWAGTMSRSRIPGTAALYRLEAGCEIACAIPGTTLSNGIGWSPDGTRMYFIDSPTQRIDVLDFDGADGSLHDRRPLAQVGPDDGMPDGLAVDAEGGVWVALFGGGAIRRYDPPGTLAAHVRLPVSCPTCPTFGGAELRTLYVTTSTHRLTAEQRAQEPLAGAVLELDPGVSGLPAHRFAG
jgi:sugar lactone lactonase YvrE